MANHPYRPAALELGSRSKSFDPTDGLHSPNNLTPGTHNIASASMSSLSLADLPGPRAGEVPPALSPLDALALQGRLLAKRFEQQDKSGRRLSRLAPLTIQNEFGNRAGYFSSLSSSATNSPNEEPGSIFHQLQSSPRREALDRHRSFYPQIGGPSLHHNEPLSKRNPMLPITETNRPPMPQAYFDIPRSHSPEIVEPHIGLHAATPITPSAPGEPSRRFLSPQRKRSPDTKSTPQPHSGPLPAKSFDSLRAQRSPALSLSINSLSQDHHDDDDYMSLSTPCETLQQSRNLSPSSSSYRANSPLSPTMHSFLPRSPSVSSDHSAPFPRPSCNFSRPISRHSLRPSLDVRSIADPAPRYVYEEPVDRRPSFEHQPRRQDSGDSNLNYMAETVHTPVSMASEDFRQSGDFGNNGPTYTYSKFILPRGRTVDRRSLGVADFFDSQITWDQPKQKQARPPSPESPPRSFEQSRGYNEDHSARDASMNRSAPSLASSNDTMRAKTKGSKDITAQDHCDMGLALHEAGELLKSTYHLRLAARAGLPEAMFWYGLACRHGWGMRENKAEALQWIRRAVDSGQLEVAGDEDPSKQGNPTDSLRKKQHRAQYAVAIYELGKCHGNGWGAVQDKPLALRCYEIAGSWGDADALVEAGYCYAEAVGCKKDMKKAAKFYRAAEAKGVSMVGNSWIYKDKYMDDGSTVSDARSVRSGRSTKRDNNSEKKPRDKSRTRTIFGRKKSYTVTSK